MIERDWHRCYKGSWKGVIVDDAFAHPAKFSRALIRRIYEHAFEQGWLEYGDSVVDPFGGVALGALQAMRHGLHWFGCELEPRFVDLGRLNIEKWNAEYAPLFWNCVPSWGTARLVQGDSRDLVRVVGEVGCCVSSPPFNVGDSASAQSIAARTDKSADWIKNNTGWKTGYGSSQGQLANLPEGDFCAAVSSPPYVDRSAAPTDVQGYEAGQLKVNAHGEGPGAYGTGNAAYKRHGAFIRGANTSNQSPDYGTAPGQLGAMPAGEFAAACVSSPPFENQNSCNDQNYHKDRLTPGGPLYGDYGCSQGQLGQESGDTFWTAARAIVAQTYQVLRPGAVAIWVTKSFVRNKARVDFPGQWLQLCEAVGFERLEWVRAWLVEDNGTQGAMFGEDVRLVKERKSFFRRLAEKNGSPPIDYEVVVIVRKPDA